VTGGNQLWVADFTYIRLNREFVYLAVILDAWSRRVVGWALERTLAARQPGAGLVHHSDREIQYASQDYVSLLNQHQMTPSMRRL